MSRTRTPFNCNWQSPWGLFKVTDAMYTLVNISYHGIINTPMVLGLHLSLMSYYPEHSIRNLQSALMKYVNFDYISYIRSNIPQG